MVDSYALALPTCRKRYFASLLVYLPVYLSDNSSAFQQAEETLDDRMVESLTDRMTEDRDKMTVDDVKPNYLF